ncbi:hypothetical protein BBJ28_00013961 [Nothophytophthora sp. Chile5]|nr:hypothetical protein BBJ28_00013961 [Nothophytophthora sp. Chile5]
MNLRRFAAAFSLGVAGLVSTVRADTCTANESFTFLTSMLPSDFGLDVCISNNIWTVTEALGSTLFSDCSITDLYGLSSDAQVLSVVSLIQSIVAAPGDISSIVYQHMADTTSDDMDAFCSTLNSVISPCALKLLPKLLPALQADADCCSEISDLIDLLNFFVPSDKTNDAFLLNELINGVDQFFCSSIGETTCGANMYSQMTTTYTTETFTLLESVVLPFVTISAGDECSAMSGVAYTDSASLAPATTINYSCCIHHMRPLIQSIQTGFEYFFGDPTIEILNGMIEFTAVGGQFVDAVPGTASCTFADTCTDPEYLIEQQEVTRTPGAKAPGKNDLVDTTCTMVDKCNSAGTVCSSVCEKGSASVSSWLNQTLAYQRNLAFSGKLCYAQLPSTHNSAITLADGYGNRDQLFNANLDVDKWWSYLKTNNQMLSMTDQLGIGMRWLEIDTHFFLDDFHTGHCGTLGSDSIQSFFDAFDTQLAKYGTNLWGPELLGCFPSVSGIKASEQMTTRDSMQEIMDWLTANPTEFVVVYLDTGSDVSRLDKYTDLNALLTEIFGDLIVPETVLQELATNAWTSGSVDEFVSAGYRVLLLANDDTGLAYSLYDFCGGHEELTVDYIDTLPDASRLINGLTIYGNDYFLRSYSEQLRYISLSAAGALTEAFPVFLDADSIPKYVRWNLNLIATDNVDGAKMKAQAWSWAENEPSTTEPEAYVLMDTTGRWVASTTAAQTSRACWNSSTLSWSIVAFAETCADGTTFSAPADPYQNYLLSTALAAQGITDTSVVINASLTL